MKVMTMKQQIKTAGKEVAKFNDRYSVGQKARVWIGVRGEGEPSIETETTTPAQALGGHTAVVWVKDVSGCIALSHIEALGK